MNRCSAPCVGYISKKEYSFDVKNAINFLSGDTKKTIIDLQKKWIFTLKKKIMKEQQYIEIKSNQLEIFTKKTKCFNRV